MLGICRNVRPTDSDRQGSLLPEICRHYLRQPHCKLGQSRYSVALTRYCLDLATSRLLTVETLNQV